MPLSIVFTIMQLPLMQRHALPEEAEEEAKG
jgi:intracellular septation protein